MSGKGKERWRVALNSSHATGVSVAPNGRCFVTSERGILALDGPVVRWEVDTVAHWGCVPLDDGLLVTAEADGLVVREQRTGAAVTTIEATTLSVPVPMANVLVFLAARQRDRVLRAVTVHGELVWEVGVHASLYRPLVRHDRVLVTEGTVVHAFDAAGSPLWSTADRPGAVDGPLVGLPNGNVLVPIRADDVMGYLVVDPSGEVRAVPAHLRPGGLVAPLHSPGRELVVLPGWPEQDTHGESRPTVTVVDLDSGDVVSHHRVPAEVQSMAGTTGLVAVAGSPTWEYWSKYHGWPGFDLRADCYVFFLDQDGIRAEWKAGKPITGPIAVGPDGDLLVPVSGELVSLE